MRDEGGQAIFLVAIVMLALVMAVGLAVDTGQLFSGRRSAQQAADSAAFAGAVLLFQQGCPWAATCTATQVSNATSAATSDASLNGYATDTPTTGTTVTVSSPPSAGSFANNALCVRVVVSTPIRTTLVPQTEAFTTVKATGTACASQYNAGYALMALDKTCITKTLQEGPNGTLAIHGGNLYVNSCSPSAGYAEKTVTLDSGYGAYFDGGATPWPSVSPGTTTMNTGVVQADPFAGTPGPPTTGLTAQTCTGPALSPGIYTCKIGPGSYTMASGYYIFEGNPNGITLTGNSTLTGTGVLIYLTTSNYPSSGGTCASLSIGGNGTTTISAATSGPYAGMLIYQDSQCTGDISIGGNGMIASLTGSIYAPTGSVSTNGTNATITLTQIVANQENVQNGNVTINYAAASAYVGYVPALIE